MVLKKILRRMLRMCPEAWYIFIRTIQLITFLLFCAFMLMLDCHGQMGHSYKLFTTAAALNEISQALLLIAVILSVCIEDIHT